MKVSTNDLQSFFDQPRNGANGFLRHWMNRRVAYSDGVEEMAELAGGFWLLDILATEFEPVFARADESLATIDIRVADHAAIISMFADEAQPPIHIRRVEFTDFPPGRWTLFMGNDGDRRTIILPSEY